MSGLGLKDAIVPDFPPDEAHEYFNAMGRTRLDPILLYPPNASDERLAYIAERARGFAYCAARPGLTGTATEFPPELAEYLGRRCTATELPLAVGLGVRDEKDIKCPRSKADIATMGSHSIRTFDEQGIPGIRSLAERLVATSAARLRDDNGASGRQP